MSKAKWLKVVNPLLGVSILVQAATGIGSDHMPDELFEHLHILGGLAVVVFAIAHTALNWGWFRSSYFTKKRAD